MASKKLSILLLSLFTGVAFAQIVALDPDWKESEAPSPPSFTQKNLIPLNMPNYVSLKFGVDPQTLTITSDGIVRYVVVATNSSGSMAAMYEGIRCATGEVKTYARFNSSGEWDTLKRPEWLDLAGKQPSKHALVLARQGVCEGATSTGLSVTDIVRALRK
ncbi:CNP1-like family protein [Rhodoferax sp. PAMC 29310]|uniref:CNP1-like family protein n=1 Tax=Rhodoferax sp. PAMC 29310 TaxID=2822760 RepID=UPI001B32D995|nr:CNP1-like family protein [Rhodoferax sp. PAMC 29310]